MKTALNQFMQGAAASPACASNSPFDRADTWTIIDKQDFAIQIESQQSGARFWFIPEWIIQDHRHQ
ncbi:hypothetical protein [Pseudomonas sp. FW305-70]|uniref:hypothetical protein n=1 Tax=Pseudomonas sp. FW305-70 TaxID=2751342 RepID=UPI000C87FFF4|nr:hypothetical protein [Pseudomonas sp. FW305-70]PMZ70551.1 hypothetical protein C1X65_25965 [Pseudomonas sp. FW305-70]